MNRLFVPCFFLFSLLSMSLFAQHKPPKLIDIYPGSTGSAVDAALAVMIDGKVYLQAAGEGGQEPFVLSCGAAPVSIGSPLGFGLIGYMEGTGGQLRTFGSRPRYFTKYNGLVYFAAYWEYAPKYLGTALFATTGDPYNYTKVADLHIPTGQATFDSFTHSPTIGGLVKAGNYLYFPSQNSSPSSIRSYNVELWRSDGTSAGTLMTPEINLQAASSTVPMVDGGSCPLELTPMTVNGVDYLFFTADNVYTRKAANQLTANIAIDTLGNREVYMRLANDPITTPSTRIEINPLTSPAPYNCALCPLSSSRPEHLTIVNDKIYFIASDNGYTGIKSSMSKDALWWVDVNGNKGSITLPNGARIDRRFKPKLIGNNIFFAARTPATGVELWKYDGTNPPSMVMDITGDATDGLAYSTVTPYNWENIGNMLYFAGQKTLGDVELYQCDGTTISIINADPGTPGSGIVLGPGGSKPRRLANINGVLYFFITNSLNKLELWRHIPQTCAPYPTAVVYSNESMSTAESDYGIIRMNEDFYIYISISTNREPYFMESCPTVTVDYSPEPTIVNTICKSGSSTTATPTITFTKTSSSACVADPTTPADICPAGDCFSSATLGSTASGGALDPKTGVINLNNANATNATHTITYTYKDGSGVCEVPICFSLTIQGATAAEYLVETVAGDGSWGAASGNPLTSSFKFSSSTSPAPSTDDANVSVAFSPDGKKMYIADEFNHKVRVLDFTANTLTDFAGAGFPGYNDGSGTSVGFRNPSGIATDAAGYIYVADKGNHIIRRIDPVTGVTTTYAGSPTISGGYEDNTNPSLAKFAQPADIVVDNAGNVYVSDKNNHVIRKILPTGQVTTLAGKANSSLTLVDGTGDNARFNFPSGLSLDVNGDIIVADRLNHAIRRVTPAGVVTTIAGTGIAGNTLGAASSAQFNLPSEVSVSPTGKIYVADANNNKIKEISAGMVADFAGDGAANFLDGTALNAKFKSPSGVTFDPAGKLYVVDKLNQRIRRVRLNSQGGDINGSATVCYGTNTGLLTLVNYQGAPATSGITRWESSTNNGTTWTSLSNGNSATYTFNNLTATTIFRVVLSESACGTVYSNLATVTVIVPPTPTLVSVPSVCKGTASVMTVSGAANGDYIWYDAADVVIAGENNSTLTRTLTANTTFKCAIKQGACVGAKLMVNAVVYDLPMPIVSGTNTVCSGNTYTYTVTNNAGNTYNWIVTGASGSPSSTTNSITVTWGTGAVGTITAEETTPAPASCKGTSAVYNVTINPTPTQKTISGAASVCVNGTQTYTTTATAGGTLTWTATGGTPAAGTGNSATITWNAIGTGKVSWVETLPTTCSRLDELSVVVNDLPTTKTIAGTTNVCVGKDYIYSYTPTGSNASLWSVATLAGGNGTVQTANNGTSVTINWTSAGTATLCVTETDPTTNCTRQHCTTITINGLPTAQTIAGSAAVCVNVPQTYTVSQAGSNTYAWAVTQGTANVMAGTGTSFAPTFTAGGAAKICVTETNPTTTCSVTYCLDINVNTLPTAQTIAGNATVCAGTTQTYSVTNTGNTFTWSLAPNTGGTLTPNSASADIAWTTAGTYTVQVIEQNGNGCTTTNTLSVTVVPIPNAPTISPTTAVCAGSIVTYTATGGSGTFQWTIDNNGTITTQTGNSISVTWADVTATTTGILKVKEMGIAPTNCAGVEATQNITINPKPTSAPTLSPTADICAGKTQVYTVSGAAGSSFEWTEVTGGTAAQTLPFTGASLSIVWNNNATQGIIKVKEITANGCKADNATSFTINLLPLPTPVSISPTATICGNAKQVYTIANPVAGVTYDWAITGGTPATASGTSLEITWGTGATGTVVINGTTAGSCSAQVLSQNITLNSVPATPALASTANVCVGGTQTYNVASPVVGDTYTWKVTNGTPATGSGTSLSITWDALAASGTIELTRVSAGGCTSTPLTQTINFNPLPADQTITGASPVCLNGTENYSVAVVAGNTYTWKVETPDFAQTASGTGNTAAIKWIKTGTATLSFEETVTATGCKKTHTKTVQINVTPTLTSADIVGNNVVCTDGQSTFSVANPNGYTVTWSATGGTIADPSANPVTVVWGANPVSISLTFSAGSCTASATKNVTGVTAPTVTFTPTTASICIGGTTTHTAPDAPVGQTYIYEWKVSNSGTPQGSLTGKTLTTKWDVINGTEYVQLTITIAGTNCSATSPMPASPTDLGFVTVNPLPTPAIAGKTTVCPNEVVTYTTPNVVGNTYDWTITGDASKVVSGNSVTVTWGATGVGSVALKETNGATTCFAEKTASITISPAPSAPTSPDRFVCNPPKVLDLSATATNAVSYVWYDAATGGNVLATTQIYSPNVTATTSYWVSAINAGGCEGERKEVKITVNPASTGLVLDGKTTPADKCVASGDSPSGTITLTVQGNNGPYAFSWTKVGDPTFSSAQQNLVDLTKGDYQVVVTDAGGCTTTSPVYTIIEQLKLLQSPEIVHDNKALADDELIVVALNANVSLKAQATDAKKFEWKDANNVSLSTEQVYAFVPNAVGEFSYNVTITNSRECSAVRRVRVKVVALNVFVPNVFSPNQDTKNDRLQVFGNGIKQINFKVYNRLGEVVFETNEWIEGNLTNEAKGWDGYYRGKLQENGNYTWLLSVTYINDTTYKNTGNVYLKY